MSQSLVSEMIEKSKTGGRELKVRDFHPRHCEDGEGLLGIASTSPSGFLLDACAADVHDVHAFHCFASISLSLL